jgi:MFS family permease
MSDLRSELRALPREAWILFFGTFLNRFGSFVHPFLVLYLGSKGYGAAAGGFALGAYGVGHGISSLAGGWLADRIGRRNSIVISMVSSAIVMLALSQAETYWTIVGLATLAGVAAELYRPAASALLADLTPAGNRVIAFATYRLAINAGFAFGPATAGLLAKYSFTWLFVGDAITSLLYAVVALVALPQGLKSAEGEAGWMPAIRHAVADRRFLGFLAASMIASIAFFQFESTFALHVIDAGFSAATYGLLVSLNGFMIIFLELPIASLTRTTSRPRAVMALGYALVGIGFAVNIFAFSIPLMVLSVVIWTLGEMTNAPLGGAYVSDLAPPDLRGRYMGLWALTWSVGLTLGPALGTWIYASSPTAVWVLTLLCGLTAAAIMYEKKGAEF